MRFSEEDPEAGQILQRVETDHAQLAPIVRKILDDYPCYSRNVFIMMRFKRSKQFDEIVNAIREGLHTYGLYGIRADDKAYTDDLWLNICAYMWSSKFGVAVLEDFEERDFNPNIALEYGFMMGLGRRVLLLKEDRMPRVPSDITGKLWKPFSVFDIHPSITRQVALWAVDLGFSPTPQGDPGYVPPIEFAPLMKDALLQRLTAAVKLKEGSSRIKTDGLLNRLRAIDVQRNPRQSLEDLWHVYLEARRLQIEGFESNKTEAAHMMMSAIIQLRGE